MSEIETLRHTTKALAEAMRILVDRDVTYLEGEARLPFVYNSQAMTAVVNAREALRAAVVVVKADAPGEPVVPTKLVQQRPNAKDCFLACMAMAEGTQYDDLASRVMPDLLQKIQEHGAYDKDLAELLGQCGWMKDYHYRVAWGFRGPLAVFGKQWLYGRRALLQVNSINFPDESHIVYWDGEALFDPSLLKTLTEESIWNEGFDWAWLVNDRWLASRPQEKPDAIV